MKRVLGGIGGYFDLVGRMEELERGHELLRARVIENELEWTNQVDKLNKIFSRTTKRIADGTAAIMSEQPTPTDVRGKRALRRIELHKRRLGNEP